MNKSALLVALMALLTCKVSFINAQSLPAPQKIQALELEIKDDPLGRVDYETAKIVNPFTGKIPDDIFNREQAFHRKTKSLYERRSGTSKIDIENIDWINLGPPKLGGRTRALGADVRDDSIYIAAGVSAGIWKTVDAGQTWKKTSSPQALQSATSIAQDPRPGFEDTWYCVGGEARGASAGARVIDGVLLHKGNGVVKSTDNGDTWSIIPGTASNTPHLLDTSLFDKTWRVAVNPVNGDVFVATSRFSIVRSSDGGATWTTAIEAEGNYFSDIMITATGVCYATISADAIGESGIFRSTDGINWTNITGDFPSVGVRRIAMGHSLSNENIVYFFGETIGSGISNHSLFKYTYTPGEGNGDGTIGNGGSWEDRSSNLPVGNVGIDNVSTQNSYNVVVGVHPSNPDVVFLGDINLYRSTDGFASIFNTEWIGGYANDASFAVAPNHHPDNHALVFFPNKPNSLLSAHDGGISFTDNSLRDDGGLNPVGWVALNNGYLSSQPYTVAIADWFDNDIVMAGFQDNGTRTSTDLMPASESWYQNVGGDGSWCALYDEAWYSSSQLGVIIRFDFDAVGNFIGFRRIDPEIEGENGFPEFITPFAVDPNNREIMYLLDRHRVLRCPDMTKIPSGVGFVFPPPETWEIMSNTNNEDERICILDVSTKPANRLIYGTRNGQIYRVDNANVGNPLVTNITGSNFSGSGYVSCIKIDPDNADRIFVTISSYEVKSIFMTEDGGTTWTDISGNLEENADGSGAGPSVRWIEQMKFGDDELYFVATSIGVYATETLDGASTIWTQLSSDFIGNVVVDMIRGREDGTIALASHGNGVYIGHIPLKPKVDFKAIETTISVGSSLGFEDLSTGNPTSWTWTFEGADSAMSTLQNPIGITYQTPGCYEVKLVAGNDLGSDSLTKSCYITVVPEDDVMCGCSRMSNIDTSEAIAYFTVDSLGGGYPGHNLSQHAVYAERYEAPVPGLVNAIGLYPIFLEDPTENGLIGVFILNEIDDVPGDILFSGNLPISALVSNEENYITLPSEIEVNGAFYVAISLNYQDSSVVIMGAAEDRGPNGLNTSFLLDPQSQAWLPSTDVAGVLANTSFAFSAFYCTNIDTTIVRTVCAGSDFTFADGTTMTNITNPITYTSTLTSQEYSCDSTVTEVISLDSAIQTVVDTMICLNEVYETPQGFEMTADSNGLVTHTITLQSSGGCDSIVTYKVHTKATVIRETVCYGASYTFADGNTTDNIYEEITYASVFNGIPVMGCDYDSTVIEHVRPKEFDNSNNPIVFTVPVFICDGNPYVTPQGDEISEPGEFIDTLKTSEGCDSVVTYVARLGVGTTFSDLTIEACGEYVSPSGQVITNTQVFNDTIPNMGGCDSVITIDVTIKEIDNSVNLIADTLWAVEEGISYQWVRCWPDSIEIIEGETNQSYSAPESGDYAVILTDGVCTDTSECTPVILVSLTGLKYQTTYLFPNPTTDVLQIQNTSAGKAQYVIYDGKGRQVLSLTGSQATEQIDMSKLSKGIYFIEISSKEGVSREKIVKN